MKPKTRQITILIISAALLSLFSSSCGTVHGFGHDVEHVGDAIEGSTR
ncbi:entericidin A/B family lipoprotein [Akkermansiaceae bacterium]|nr:entericidin A/B family lipoprotein [Akkermansiaceae bacterium]